MVFPPPVRVQLRDPALCLVEVECEYLRKFGDGKGSISHGEALKHPIRVRLVGPHNFHHDSLVCPVERFRKLVQRLPEALRKALLQHFELTEHPSKPGRIVSGHHKTKNVRALTSRRPSPKVSQQPFSCPPLAISSS